MTHRHDYKLKIDIVLVMYLTNFIWNCMGNCVIFTHVIIIVSIDSLEFRIDNSK